MRPPTRLSAATQPRTPFVVEPGPSGLRAARTQAAARGKCRRKLRPAFPPCGPGPLHAWRVRRSHRVVLRRCVHSDAHMRSDCAFGRCYGAGSQLRRLNNLRALIQHEPVQSRHIGTHSNADRETGGVVRWARQGSERKAGLSYHATPLVGSATFRCASTAEYTSHDRCMIGTCHDTSTS
jgi:hypothetical protein